nr:MAG TPA: hypothetical protein [Herelleviridae sp.]
MILFNLIIKSRIPTLILQSYFMWVCINSYCL